MSPEPPLPTGWTYVPVREVGEVRLGRQRSPQFASGRNAMPYLRVANVFDGHIDFSDVLSMDFTEAERQVYSVEPGDIFLNEGQSIELVGRCAIYRGPPGQYCFQNTLVRFRCGPRAVPEYCRGVFKHWLDHGRFMQVAKQTTSIAHLGADRFAAMRMPLPPRAEQEGIAEALVAIDELIAQTEAEVEKLRVAAEGVSNTLLSERQLWSRSDVESEFDVAAGFTLGPHRTPRLRPHKYLRVANVQRGLVDLAEVLELDASPEEVAQKCLQESDLLVVEGHANPDEIGRCALVPKTAVGMTFQNHLFRLRSRTLLPRFAEAWMNSAVVRAYWRRQCGTSSGLNTINRSMLKRVEVRIPPLPEQRRIVAILDDHDARIRAAQAERDKLVAIKRGLLDDLLTGRVRVPAARTE